jgi:hypothetical protein
VTLRSTLALGAILVCACSGKGADKKPVSPNAPSPAQLRESALTSVPFLLKQRTLLGLNATTPADTAGCGALPPALTAEQATDTLRHYFLSGGVETFLAWKPDEPMDSTWQYGAWRLDDGTASGEWKNAQGGQPDAVFFAAQLGADSVPKLHSLAFSISMGKGKFPTKWTYLTRGEGAPCLPVHSPAQVLDLIKKKY